MISPEAMAQMAGVSPQALELVKQIGRHLTMEIYKDKRRGEIRLRYIAHDPPPDLNLGQIIDMFVEQMAAQHYSFFGIRGKILEVR